MFSRGESGMGTYTTILGDEWDGIARKVYSGVRKSDMLMHLLLEANPGYRETVIFSAGAELVIPPAPAGRITALPPWKR
jgi:phage tail protein X